jgi:YidC/Oxa1 family membrane protein insertase
MRTVCRTADKGFGPLSIEKLIIERLKTDMKKTMHPKRILTWIVVGFAVLCVVMIFESGFFDNPEQNQQGPILLQSTTETAEVQPEVTESVDPVTPPPGPQLGAAENTISFGADNAQSKTVTLGSENRDSGFKYKLVLTSKGAAVESVTFSEFDNRSYENPQPLEFLSPVMNQNGTEVFSMENTSFIFDEYKQRLPLGRLYWNSTGAETADDGSQTTSFEAIIKNQSNNESVIKLTKTYKVSPETYLMECNITVENLSAKEQNVRYNMTGPVGIERESFRSDMRRVLGGFLTAKGQIVTSENGLITSFGNTIRRKFGLSYKTGLKEATETNRREDMIIGSTLPNSYKGANFLWAAITNKYFTSILIPVPEEGDYPQWVAQKIGRYYKSEDAGTSTSNDGTVGIDLEIASNTLQPAGQAESSKEYRFRLYLGPKDKDLFADNTYYKKLGLANTITFMPCCCCPASVIRPLAFGILGLMKWMYGFIGNYGVVIIILVFLMRLVLHPVTKKSQVSMSKMTKLAPRAEQIKQKYANNKAEMNKHLMELYREQGASPMLGFLPMLIQMPIWIALWSAVYTSIDLRGAPFLPFWITDLSMPDALFRFHAVTLPLLGTLSSFNLLPVLMGVAFYLQQKLMPAQASAASNPQMAQQQKMMKIMLPLMLPLVLYKGPSGVNLYIMASTFAGVIEQYVIRKHIREKEEAESKGLVPVTKKTGGKVKKKKPKPFYKNM